MDREKQIEENRKSDVWLRDGCNGTCDCYFLCKLTDTTTGWIYAWTTNKSRAEEIAAALNEKVGEGWRNK